MLFAAVILRAARVSDDAYQVVGASGIADERLYYFAGSGFMNYSRGAPWPSSLGANTGPEQKRKGREVLVNCSNAMAGYFGGHPLYIVDTVGLGDPLLARLPAMSRWRIGHVVRDVPAGHEKSVARDQNLLRAPGLAAYYDRLRLITRGPLGTRRRFATMLPDQHRRHDPYLTSTAPAAHHGTVRPARKKSSRDFCFLVLLKPM